MRAWSRASSDGAPMAVPSCSSVISRMVAASPDRTRAASIWAVSGTVRAAGRFGCPGLLTGAQTAQVGVFGQVLAHGALPLADLGVRGALRDGVDSGGGPVLVFRMLRSMARCRCPASSPAGSEVALSVRVIPGV